MQIYLIFESYLFIVVVTQATIRNEMSAESQKRSQKRFC